MNKREKLQITKAGVFSYAVCSAILYLKEGGIHLSSRDDQYILVVEKSLGLVDMFRFDGFLQNASPFSGDFVLVAVGMLAGVGVYGWMKLTRFVDRVQNESRADG